jgi:hypothetical protein
MKRHGSPHLVARMPLKHVVALKAQAGASQLSLSAYVREVMKNHLQDVYNTQRDGVFHLREFSRLVKQFTLTYRQQVAIADGELPGSQKRSQLERIAWRAVEEAAEYTKSEDAAENAKARLLALRVPSSLLRAELAILRDQDDAFIEDLLEKLDESNAALEKESQAGLQKA